MAPKKSIMCHPLRKLIIESGEKESHQCPDGFKEKVNETEETKLCCGAMSIILNKVSAKVHKQHHFYWT
jgi:hypothetical protein